MQKTAVVLLSPAAVVLFCVKIGLQRAPESLLKGAICNHMKQDLVLSNMMNVLQCIYVMMMLACTKIAQHSNWRVAPFIVKLGMSVAGMAVNYINDTLPQKQVVMY